MKRQHSLRFSILALITLGAIVPVYADDYFDDIYYNPKKSVKETATSQGRGNYIQNFDQMDVDTYNRRGQYYMSPIDTIGSRIENGEDFVYTQQIQKFYNPRIVVDNTAALQDIIDNSYGNVEVVFNVNGPAFAGWGWNDWYYSPYVSVWGPSWPLWYCGFNWGWGPSWAWNWGPSWSWAWNWGPAWSWGYAPVWSYGPGWSYPGWGPAYHPGRPIAQYRPNGRRPNNPGGHWASTRPGGGVTGNYGGRNRPGGSGHFVTQRPGSNIANHNGGVSNQAPVGSTSRPGRYTIGSSSTTSSAHAATPSNPTRNESTTTTTPRGSRGQTTGSNVRTSNSSTNRTGSSKSSNSSSNRNSSNSGRYNSNSSNSGRYSTGSGSSGRYSTGSSGRSSGGASRSSGGGARGGRGTRR